MSPAELAPERAFAYFTRDIARWWPLASHSVGGERARSVAFDERVGGEIYETDAAGRRCAWGKVREWQPPSRLAFTWHPGREAGSAQWVEVTFEAVAPGCKVTLTHGGWEALGDRAASTRTRYASGWKRVFEVAYGEFVARTLEGRG
jgi:uncharacterized protein YndB with AHSA1/START domain